MGPNFDWTAREYLFDKPHQQLPPYLKEIAQRCAQAAGNGECSCEPDAALVNYYSPGDTLGGHRDDVEADLAQPIVSMSLGCDAVFLLGGEACKSHVDFGAAMCVCALALMTSIDKCMVLCVSHLQV